MPTFYVAQPLGYSIQTAEIDNGAVTAAKLATDAVETAKIKDANVTFAKLAALTSGNLLVGNASNVPASVAVTGDVTISNAGVTAIGASKVTEAMMADDAIGLAEMKAGTAGNLITYDASGNPAAVATGTSGQVLTSNGAGAAPTFQAAAAAKEIKAEVATWATNFTTQSTTYVDVTNAAVTLSGLDAAKTYDLIAGVSCYNAVPTTGRVSLRLDINGTIVNEVSHNAVDDEREYAHLSGMKSSVTGATSYTAKLQGVSFPTSVTLDVNEDLLTQSIFLMAVEV